MTTTTRSRRAQFEKMEVRRYLDASALTFKSQVIDCCDVQLPDAVVAADVDNDADQDVLVTTENGEVFLFENRGNGKFGPAHNHPAVGILQNVEDIRPIDLDGDGDLDLIAISKPSLTSRDEVRPVWSKNDGTGFFSSLQEIIDGEFLGRMKYVDVDGDDKIDLVQWSSSRDQIVWHQNTGKGTFTPARIVTENGLGVGASLSFGDVDSDGDLDFIGRDANASSILLFIQSGDHTFQSQSFFLEDGLFHNGIVTLSDIDGDGDSDLDLVTYQDGNHRYSWIENDGSGQFVRRHDVISDDGFLVRIGTEDFDGDGDLDFLVRRRFGMNDFFWYENVDPRSRFISHSLSGFNVELLADTDWADIDADGDLDVVTASGWLSDPFHVDWFENQSGVFTRHSINSESSRFAAGVDIDADGDIDVLATSDQRLTLYENQNGDFDDGTLLNTEDIASPQMADVDGDGDQDIIAVDRDFGRISRLGPVIWFENSDGLGTFGSANTLLDLPVTRVETVDVDNDGDLDLIAHVGNVEQIGFFEQTLDLSFVFRQWITPLAKRTPWYFDSGDIDSDGDVDLIFSYFRGGRVEWYENIDGVFRPQTISARDPLAIRVADLDGDRDLDLIVGSTTMDENGVRSLLWYQNVDGRGTFSGEPALLNYPARIVIETIETADIDKDGDIDILTRGPYLFENSGDGTFQDARQIGVGRNASIFDPDYAVHFVEDGRGFLAVDGGTSSLFYMTPRMIGDSNNDLSFDSSDLVAAFQAGEYEDTFPGNSTFSEGDWNGDGDFTSRDLVFAFIGGHYDITPSAVARNRVFDAWSDDWQRKRKNVRDAEDERFGDLQERDFEDLLYNVHNR